MPRTVKIFKLREWNDLVSSIYKKRYSFQQQDGCKEKGIFYFQIPIWKEDYEDYKPSEFEKEDIMGVSFKSWLEHDSSEKLNWDRNFYPHVSMIIDNLYNKGILKEGEYAIDINW